MSIQYNGYEIVPDYKTPPIVEFLKLVAKSIEIPILYQTYVRNISALYTKKYTILNYDKLAYEVELFQGYYHHYYMGSDNEYVLNTICNEYFEKVRMPHLLQIFAYPIVEGLIKHELILDKFKLTLNLSDYQFNNHYKVTLYDDVVVVNDHYNYKLSSVHIDEKTREQYIYLIGSIGYDSYMNFIYENFKICINQSNINVKLKLTASSSYDLSSDSKQYYKDPMGLNKIQTHNIIIRPDNPEYLDYTYVQEHQFVFNKKVFEQTFQYNTSLVQVLNQLLNSKRLNLKILN